MVSTDAFFRERYYVVDHIATGGMSEVYAALDVTVPEFVAIKFIREELADDDTIVRRFAREREIYRRLSHPNLVNMLDDGETEEDGPFIVQEFLRGRSLDRILGDFPQGMPYQAVVPIASDVAEALLYTHSHGVIHRDVQPANIMVHPEGSSRLFDFGIARGEGFASITQAGTIMGTVVYSSPEQNAGEQVDERTDVYSLGAVMFEMLTGARFNPARNVPDALEFQKLPPRSARELNPEVPEALDELVSWMLRPDPDERAPSMKEVLIRLGKFSLEVEDEACRHMAVSPVLIKLSNARKAFYAGRLDEAMEIARELEMHYRAGGRMASPAPIFYLMGKITAAQGRADKSVRYFEKALFLAPGNPDYALDYALVLVREKRYPKALRVVRDVLSRNGGGGARMLEWLEKMLRRKDEVFDEKRIHEAAKEASASGSLRSKENCVLSWLRVLLGG